MKDRPNLFATVARFFKKKDDDLWEFDLPAAYEEVRRRAYLKWEAAGKPDGKDVEFWLEAEQEVSEMARDIDQIWFTDP